MAYKLRAQELAPMLRERIAEARSARPRHHGVLLRVEHAERIAELLERIVEGQRQVDAICERVKDLPYAERDDAIRAEIARTVEDLTETH